ncbi:MAG TPA: alpha-galactosidase [Acidobacteriaceae bacterium]|nr:alpha-galactosidase [Acidobacteriaceae bacterium]
MPRIRITRLTRRQLIQSGIILAGSATLPSACTAFAGTTQSSAAAADLQTWTIGNDRIRRTIAFAPGSGLYTSALADLATGAQFILPEHLRKERASEFAFACNGQSVRGTHTGFTRISVDQAAIPHGASLTARLRHNVHPLDIDVVYRVYDNQPSIRKKLVLHNTGATPLRITHLCIESLGLNIGPEDETLLNAQYGAIPREIFYTGRSEDAALLVCSSRTGLGAVILSEVPGYMKRTEIEGWDDPEQFFIQAMYDTDLMPFERSIPAGESFSSACVSLLTFQRGHGFQDPQWVLPTYTSKTLVRRVDTQGPPWIYNTWEPFQRRVNTELVLELIDVAASMGMDVFTIDDGWQLEYGENTVNLTSFPGGLDPILTAVESKGMRLGLWIPLAAIGLNTNDYRNHPEWASRDIEGNLKTTGTMGGVKAVMCLATPFRDSAAARINEAIERFRLAYVKLDLTTIFNAYGEAPGCYAKGHFHGTWAESLNMIYEGIADVTSKIYSKHPDVLLDLTFELWGQKHIIDAGLLAAGDLDWMSNVDDTLPSSAGPRQARQLLYQRAASMPVESMLIGNIHAELPTIQESFATAIGSAPLLLGDLRKLTASDHAWYHDKLTWFKALRKRVRISESFFPLGNWQQPSAAHWDGFARLAHSGDGILVLFRNKSGAASANVQLPLMPSGKFKLRSIINGNEVGAYSQADWARGVPIKFSDATLAEVFEVTALI